MANEFINDLWVAPILKQAATISLSHEFLYGHLRRGHSVPKHTDEEWDRLRTERKLRYNKWRKLTKQLLADGVLDHDHCYECAGELKLSEDRPTDWVYDETEEEFKARMGGD